MCIRDRVCFLDLDTGAGSLLRVDAGDGYPFASIFTDPLSLEDSMEHYIARYVHRDDQEPLRQAVSREQLGEELADKLTCYVNYRTLREGRVEYFQMKAVRAGVWNGRRSVVLGFRSVDGETRAEMEKKALLEDALLQANRASKAKTTFLSNMSHDIRTPMNLSLIHISEPTRPY